MSVCVSKDVFMQVCVSMSVCECVYAIAYK